MSLARKGKAPWNKGLTKADPRVAKYVSTKGGQFKKGRSSPNKGKIFLERRGKNSNHWKGGKAKCKDCNKEFNHYAKSTRCKKCASKKVFKDNPKIRKNLEKGLCARLENRINGKRSNLELILYKYLNDKRVFFKPEYRIDFYCVDVYIPKFNLIIEADGEYWHLHPRMIWRDRAKNTYLRNKEYNLIRLSGLEIKSGKFKNLLPF